MASDHVTVIDPGRLKTRVGLRMAGDRRAWDGGRKLFRGWMGIHSNHTGVRCHRSSPGPAGVTYVDHSSIVRSMIPCDTNYTV